MDEIKATLADIKPTLDSHADFRAIVDAITQYGGGRNRSDNDPGNGGTYLVMARFYDPEADDDEVGDGENNQEANLLFAVDWDNLKLVLRDEELPLTPAEPGWTNVEEWLIGPGNELCLVREKDTQSCFLAEYEG
jgi:hypothetical protein